MNTQFYLETIMESGIFGGLLSWETTLGSKRSGTYGKFAARRTAANVDTYQSLNKQTIHHE
jgi:hypothetical protein